MPGPLVSTLVATALRMTEERLASAPPGESTHAMLASIANQLRFMRDTMAAGRAPTVEEKNRLNVGLIAVREFESTDPDYCDALAEAVFRFRQL